MDCPPTLMSGAKKRAVCARSIPESQDVCTFCHRSEEPWIHTELFPRSDFAARLARSGAGGNGQDSASPKTFLTRVQKECILLAVSAANLNSYCVAMHCNLLRGLGMPSEEGDQIAVDYHESNLSERDRALLDFAVKLGTRSSEFSRDDVVKLRTLGFSEEQILECEVVTALNNFANTLQMGLGIEPDFAPPAVFEENKVYLSGAAADSW